MKRSKFHRIKAQSCAFAALALAYQTSTAQTASNETKIVYHGKLPCETALNSPAFQSSWIRDYVTGGTIRASSWADLADSFRRAGESTEAVEVVRLILEGARQIDPQHVHPVLLRVAKDFKDEEEGKIGTIFCLMDKDCNFANRASTARALFGSPSYTRENVLVPHPRFVVARRSGASAFYSESILAMNAAPRLEGNQARLIMYELGIDRHFPYLTQIFIRPQNAGNSAELALHMIHEMTHYSDAQLISSWLKACRELSKRKLPTDAYFERYGFYDKDDDSSYLSDGFMSIFTESRAYDLMSFLGTFTFGGGGEYAAQEMLGLHHYLLKQGLAPVIEEMGVIQTQDFLQISSGERDISRVMEATIERAKALSSP